MSTLGGSRGERNAKPKFSALDINSLYRSSRGESLEPLTQKNAVPRKHGMQILGKVPSARRPPANLPSLKAETSTPTQDQSGSWPAASSPPSSNANNQAAPTSDKQTSDQYQQQKQHQQQQQQQHQKQHQQQQKHQHQQQQQQHQHHHHHHQQQQQHYQKSPNSGGNANNNNNNSSSATWSSVTSAHEPAVPKPLLYQSPQFQHEFPSLDGSNAQVQLKGSRGSANANQTDAQNNSHANVNNNNQNANANAADTQSESNRTQNDAHLEHGSHQQSGGGNSSNSAAQVHQQVVPPQFRALMPQFMHRMSGFDSLPSEPEPSMQPQMGANRDNNRRNYGNRSDGRDQQYQSYNRNARDRNDERQYRRGQQSHRSNRHDQNQYDEYEPNYQSIIKEEELDRIDQIVKEDGWVQDDEIDYNQKLVFSDDDSDTPPHTSKSKESKRVNFNDRENQHKMSQRKEEMEIRAVYNRETEREKLDREHNERNEREKSEGRMQQNGHRSGAPLVDLELLERVKQRKEEEEKRAHERRMAAAKKLQELEQKISKKKEMSNESENDLNASPPGAKSDGSEPRSNDRYSRSDDGKRDNKDARDYGNRYGSKFDRELDTRDRGTPNAGDPFFNKPYQSNLPPRFQKQRDQQDRHPFKTEPPHRPSPRDQIRRPNQSMQQPHVMKRNVDDFRDSKSPGYYKGSGGPYSTHSKTSSSGLCESEDDDRVSSGRESISRSSVGERTSHLARSTSDSSQPEFKEKIGSWADEMEIDLKHHTQRQISSTSSTSANDDIQPKQILQRVRKVSIESRSDKEKSEERELHSSIHSTGSASKLLNQSQEDIGKSITSPSMIEAPKCWGDSAPTTPEIARKSSEPLGDLTTIGSAKSIDAEKKTLESVLENEASGNEKKGDDKTNATATKTARGYGHPKESYSSDDNKHGNALKRPNARGGRHDTRGPPPSRGYGGGGGGNSSYRGNNPNWNNRRGGRRYNDYSESEGSDDEFQGRGNRGKDDRFKADSSNRRDAPQSHQKDVFVPRGEPSRRGRGGRTGGPVVKRIDNYGPPNAKSPFGASEEKSDAKIDVKPEDIASKKGEPQTSDKNVSQAADLSDGKASKVDDKKASTTKPAFSGSSQAPQRKDSTGQKVESQPTLKSDDGSKAAAISSQASQPQRIEKTPPYAGEKPQSNANQTVIGSKPDKPSVIKKDDSTYAHSSRGNTAPVNRGKPQPNVQSTIKPSAQSVPAKPVGTNTKPTQNINQSQQPVNTSSAVGGVSAANRQQQPAKMAPRFVKQQRDRTGSSSSNTWEKGDIAHLADASESDFTQRSSSSIQSIDKLSQDSGNKTDTTAKMSTIIFENTNFKSMPGPIKRQTVPTNQQQMSNPTQQAQRSGVNQYDQVQSNNLSSHHSHHQQNQHHIDKKVDDVFKNASSGNFQDMLDSQQQMQSQVQRPHPSQTDVISSALQTMSFPKSDAEYEKDLKLAFTFESEILNDTQSSEKTSKGGLCIPPSRSTAIHSVASGQNTISPSIADLSKKITSVKKVWETVPTMPPVIEHGNNANNSGNNDDSHLTSTFVSTQNQQHMHQFTHSQQQLHQSGLASYSNSFGPDPNSLDHFAKSGGQDGDIDNVGYNPSPQHIVGGNNNSHPNAGLKHNDPLSASGNVCKVKPNQPPMHQSSLGLSPPPMQQGIQTAPQPYYQPSQFGGMSAIPSPPAVLYNSSPMPSQYGVGHYERYIASAHYGAAGNAAPYNTPYMQSGPNLQAAPAPDMYQNMTSQFRMGTAINQPPYNQQQQLNNQSTVLISSTSNSLMSASVKPSSQIGAIGTKVNAGQTPYAQQYMGMYAPPQQPPPPQNSSYNNYNSSYFGAPNASYGLQATGMFNPQAQPPSNASMNQQPVASYGNFLAINRQYQNQQNNAYSQQQPSSRSQQQQQNPNQSQSQPQSGQQSQQQSNSNSQNQSGQQQSHSQDSVSNSFFK